MAHFIGSGKQVLYEPVLRALSCGVFFLVWFFLGIVFSWCSFLRQQIIGSDRSCYDVLLLLNPQARATFSDFEHLCHLYLIICAKIGRNDVK